MCNTMNNSDIVSHQRDFFSSGVTLTYEFRINALKKLRQVIVNKEQDITDALTKDLGKNEFEGYMAEVSMVLAELGHTIKHLKKWMKPHHVSTPIASMPGKSYTVNEPYGVALVMAPWNYPFLLTISPLIGAIAGGNCCVLKPSNYSLNTSNVIYDIITAVFSPNYVSVILGGRSENTQLLAQKFDYIFFTGGVTVGKIVLEAAAKNITPVTLELGGKSPVIVDETADIDIAAKRIAWGKFLNAGQTCVAPDYVFVHKIKMNLLMERIKHYVFDFYGAMPLKCNYYPKMIDERHLHSALDNLENVKLYMGGDYDLKTLKISPTIVINPPMDSKIMNDEIFAPILPIVPYENIEDVISHITSRPKPLALYLFTKDKALEKRIVTSVSFGGGCINDTIMHLASSSMPFGGVGQSGMGGYHGKDSFDTFTHKKSILKHGYHMDVPVRYHPATSKKLNFIKSVMK